MLGHPSLSSLWFNFTEFLYFFLIHSSSTGSDHYPIITNSIWWYPWLGNSPTLGFPSCHTQSLTFLTTGELLMLLLHFRRIWPPPKLLKLFFTITSLASSLNRMYLASVQGGHHWLVPACPVKGSFTWSLPWITGPFPWAVLRRGEGTAIAVMSKEELRILFTRPRSAFNHWSKAERHIPFTGCPRSWAGWALSYL